MAPSKPATPSTPDTSSPQINPEVAGPLAMLNFDIPTWMQVPTSMTAAIADGATDELASMVVDKAATTFLDPVAKAIPGFGDMIVALPGYQTFRSTAAIALLYGAVWMDDRYVRSQIEQGSTTPKSYVPPVVAALVLKAARRKAGDFAGKILPKLTSFFRETKKDIEAVLGGDADPSGAPTS